MELEWTQEVKTYAEAFRPDGVRIPNRSMSLGCQVGVWPVHHGSTATFEMGKYIGLVKVMIDECMITERKVGRLIIPGVRRGVILAVSGYTAIPPWEISVIGMNNTAEMGIEGRNLRV